MEIFVNRHIGPKNRDIQEMLQSVGVETLEQLINETVPMAIRSKELQIPDALTEFESLKKLRSIADKNQIFRSYLGLGYHNTITPPVILRNLIENPSWYTSYTPYQAEISQGRLESLLIFQTMIQDLTCMDISNCSLLDEATAAAEAMTMSHRLVNPKRSKSKASRDQFFVSNLCHPNTISVLQGRAEPLGIEVIVGDHEAFDFSELTYGVLLQYPATDGSVIDYQPFIEKAKANASQVIMATDLLSLTLLKAPGEMGADIVVGNSQRFGVPLGYGGPHAAFLATREDFKRSMPGRIIGITIDADGNKALRMALQSREQHIRREKATSNVCTAQALLANVAAMYAVYHGPEGLKAIAKRIHLYTQILGISLATAGYGVTEWFFDTIAVEIDVQERKVEEIIHEALERGINLRTNLEKTHILIALDETVTINDIEDIVACFDTNLVSLQLSPSEMPESIPENLKRTSEYLQERCFQDYRSETEMMRYLHRLASKDLGLNTAMIPLGSCTMKLNAASEMIPISWAGFNGLHPYAPPEQAQGYQELFSDLENWLAEITGFDAVSLQPNAGSQGEYAGLLAIRGYHLANGDAHRTICLIPSSAHGTNPASAVMAGMEVVKVNCDEEGNIDVSDLKAKAEKYKDTLSSLMITYPSTHGVFEESIQEVCSIIHDNGGQVYMDGANMNAMVGISRPGDIGADVCHLNLHKTFAIPHGGGGPGMGPIGVKEHLKPYLPGHPLQNGVKPVSAAPFGSSSILPISWAYIAMLGADGVTQASKIAILAANYLASCLKEHYPVLYTGKNGRCAHECILDLRPFKQYGIEAVDVAKRLMDYGFHAPTMSWPVSGTLMVEPTESESLSELDRFIEAMILIRNEIQEVIDGKISAEESPLHHAPHTQYCLVREWKHSYSREKAVFPTKATQEFKYWPTVRRVNDAYGDRNLICSCQAWFGDEE